MAVNRDSKVGARVAGKLGRNSGVIARVIIGIPRRRSTPRRDRKLVDNPNPEKGGGWKRGLGEVVVSRASGGGKGGGIIVRLSGIHHSFLINSRAIRTLGNMDFGVCRNRFIAVVNGSNSNGSALLGRLNYLSAPSGNRCCLSNIDIHGVDHGSETVLHGHGVNFVFRGCGLLPGAADMRGMRLPLVCGPTVDTRSHGRHTVRTLGTMKLNRELCRGDGRVSNKRVRHMTVTHTLIGGPTIVLTSRTANGLSAEADFRVLILFRGLCTRNEAVVFMARGPSVTGCSDHGVRLHSKRVVDSACGSRVLSTTRNLTTLPTGASRWLCEV